MLLNSRKILQLLEFILIGPFILFIALQKQGIEASALFGETIPWFFIHFGVIFTPILLAALLINFYLLSSSLEDFLRRHLFSVIVVVPMIISWGDLDFTFWPACAHLLSSVLFTFYESKGESNLAVDREFIFLGKMGLAPAQLIIFSYLGVILLGTSLLMLPYSTVANYSLHFVDALFIATSALCITGLTPVVIAENFSVFGQLILLVLIQIGGISIMTLYSSMIILMGKTMGMRDQVIMQDTLDVTNPNELFRVIVSIIKFTFVIEIWGAVLLTIGFTMEGFEFSEAFYHGVFHSISGFCQAGFSTFPTSLESFATNPLINITMVLLLILGSIGFLVISDVLNVFKFKKGLMNLNLHSKVTIIMHFALIFVSVIFIFFGEFLYSLNNYSFFEKLQIALFQSATMRSGGLNTLPISQFQVYTIFLIMIFMFIGGGSGSCAGGIRLTTFSIIAKSVLSTLRGEKAVTLFDRRIPAPIVVRAIAITFLYLSVVAATFFFLVFFERDQSFLLLLFETVSACATVGLSLGITEFLSHPSKIVLCLSMIIGRIGPLTLLVALSYRGLIRGKYDYPDGRIMIG